MEWFLLLDSVPNQQFSQISRTNSYVLPVAFQWSTTFGLHHFLSKIKEKKGKGNNLAISLHFQFCVSLEKTIILNFFLVPKYSDQQTGSKWKQLYGNNKQGAKWNNFMKTWMERLSKGTSFQVLKGCVCWLDCFSVNTENLETWMTRLSKKFGNMNEKASKGYFVLNFERFFYCFVGSFFQ